MVEGIAVVSQDEGRRGMTKEEAIGWLKYAVPIRAVTSDEFSDFITAVNMAIESLEKQIPKKPVKSKKPRYGMGYDYYDWECPTCGSFLAFESDLGRLKKIHHCKCGQAINKEN